LSVEIRQRPQHENGVVTMGTHWLCVDDETSTPRVGCRLGWRVGSGFVDHNVCTCGSIRRRRTDDECIHRATSAFVGVMLAFSSPT